MTDIEDSATPKWINGPPNTTGLWIVQCNGDFYCWRVEMDADENDQGGVGAPYLRFSDNDTSEPLDDYQWPPERSYGPCPLPDGNVLICSARVALSVAAMWKFRL